MKIFMTHYTPLIERKKFQETQMKKENMEVEYIEAYDREQLTEHMISRFTEKKKISDISLTLKHIDIYNKLSSCNDIPYALVLEDDVILKTGFMGYLEHYLRYLPEDWDMLFIGDGCGLHIPINQQIPGQYIYKKSNVYPGSTRCADSYVINRKCAIQIIDRISQPGYEITHAAADWFLNVILRDMHANVYWAEPTIATQGSDPKNNMFKSSIIR